MTAFGEDRAKEFVELLDKFSRATVDHGYAHQRHDAEQDVYAWVNLVLDDARTVESQLAQAAPDAEMLAWVDRIAAERIRLLQRKYVKGSDFTKEDQERLEFCRHVVTTAYPSVTLAQWRALDDLNTRYEERHK